MKIKRPLILGINGSAHVAGHVAGLLNLSLNEAKSLGARVKKINLGDYKVIPHSGKLDPKTYLENTKDDIILLQKLVLESDGIIFASPTHWFASSSLMKIFIDRLTSLEDFGFLLEGKVAGFITYGPQGGALNNAMQLLMIANQWGMVSPPYSSIFDEGRRDKWIEKDCKLLGRNMLKLINVSQNSQVNWGYSKSNYKVFPTELLKTKK